MKLPRAMGMVFCERLEPQSMSLQKVFQGLYFRTFPAIAMDFVAYTALYSGGIEGKLQLECVRLEDEMDIFRYSMWRELPAGAVVQLMLPVRQIQFPTRGRYMFRLLFDNRELTHRFPDVFRLE